MVTFKMKSRLHKVAELSNKYVDLAEFKKGSCIPVEPCTPFSRNEEDEEESAQMKLELIKLNKRKKRRY